MHVELLPVTPDDMEEMVAIFNHYVEHSLATWTELPVSVGVFGLLMNFTPGYPAYTARDAFGTLAGFGLLRPYSPIPAFDHTAELTCFLDADFTGKGVGTAMLRVLEADAIEMGIDTIIATVSSLNQESLGFHCSRGFVERGRLWGVGLRGGRRFDVVLLQKMLRVYGNDEER